MTFPPMPSPTEPTRIRTGARDRAPAAAAAAAAATVGLALATGPLVWWAVGDLSIAGVPADQLDHAWGPYAVDLHVEYAVGAIAALTAALALAALVRATLTRRLDPRWWWVVAQGCLASGVLALAWRVMTSGVIGANIGGGALALLTPLVVAGLLLGAAVTASALRHAPTLPRVAAIVPAAASAPALFAVLWFLL